MEMGLFIKKSKVTFVLNSELLTSSGVCSQLLKVAADFKWM